MAHSVLGYLSLTILLVQSSLARDTYHRRQSQPETRDVGGRNPAENTAEYWKEEARVGLEGRLEESGDVRVARGIILFLGDGMSLPTLAAARTLLGQRAGRSGEEAQLSFEAFPTVGLAKTYCADAQIADSACTATAYLGGVKNNIGTIGVTAAVSRTDCSEISPENLVHSIAEWALADGRDAGVVSTARLTDASPAGTFAHVADRHWESDVDVVADCPGQGAPRDIAYQLVHSYPGNQLKVILGGGRQEFLPETIVDEEGTRGRRTDGRNLINEWVDDKVSRNVSHKYIWDREELMELSASPPDYLLGLFENGHMQYHLLANTTTEPTLAELTEVAIRSLSRNERGFFLFVEGGRIDHAHHDNRVQLALDETLELSAAVARATELLPEDDVLLLVTADHAHVMSYSGYTHRGGNILGTSDDIGADGLPYMTLSYANGPGARPQVHGHRVDVTGEENFGSPLWASHAEVPLSMETHGGEDVAVFARGPQHALFGGVFEQSQLPRRAAAAACLSAPRPSFCGTA